MAESEEKNIEMYIRLLRDSLDRKKDILTRLYEETARQEALLDADTLDFDAMESAFRVKSPLIDELLIVDEGFEKSYAYVQKEITTARLKHRQDIIALQTRIEEITILSTKIEALENKNYGKMQMAVANGRQGIRQVKQGNQAANKYYKNMAKINNIEPSFIDKKG